MKNPRLVEIDWLALKRAFERFDPTWEGEPLPYLNLRTGKVSYFGVQDDVDLSETLDFERHIALTLSDQAIQERHARMRAFVATVSDPELSDQLRDALSQQGGVASFYDILLEHPKHYERWQRVEEPRVRELIRDWLRAEQLQVLNAPPWNS